MQDNQLEPQDDDPPEEIVEHLTELGFHPEDNDPEDDGLDEILKMHQYAIIATGFTRL